MTVQTDDRAYRGRKVETYETKRKWKRKWIRENELVEKWLVEERVHHQRVLDVPCGTGRFFELYKKLGLTPTCFDLSEDMVVAAKKRAADVKLRGAAFAVGNVKDVSTLSFPTVICVRLLHLLHRRYMVRAMEAVCAAARERVILTIQMRDDYAETPDVTTHSEIHFRALIRRLGWTVSREEKITGAGWRVMMLEKQ